MFWLIFGIHMVLCLILVFLVLLQQGKGADMGPAFGSGASNTLFGVGGATPFVVKFTTIVCVAFMVTSILLIKQFGVRAKEVSVSSDLTSGTLMENVPLDTKPLEGVPAESAPTGGEASNADAAAVKPGAEIPQPDKEAAAAPESQAPAVPVVPAPDQAGSAN